MFSHYSFHINISIILKSNFTEEKDIYKHYMYEHIHMIIFHMIMHDYLCMFIHIYTYSCMKNCLP